MSLGSWSESVSTVCFEFLGASRVVSCVFFGERGAVRFLLALRLGRSVLELRVELRDLLALRVDVCGLLLLAPL
jgi:hypothetical protein